MALPTIHPALFEFLKAIREHNSRKYFASIRPLYDDIQANLQEVVHTLAHAFAYYDPQFATVQAKNCLFRIYRDARRLKEGDYLYKYNVGAVIHPEGRKTTKAAPYFHLQPGNSFFGGGIYASTGTELQAIRTWLSQHGKSYYHLIRQHEFQERFGEIQGTTLRGRPRGFDRTSAYPELIKQQQWLIIRPYSDEQVLADNFLTEIINDFRIAQPFFEFLNTPLQ